MTGVLIMMMWCSVVSEDFDAVIDIAGRGKAKSDVNFVVEVAVVMPGVVVDVNVVVSGDVGEGVCGSVCVREGF